MKLAWLGEHAGPDSFPPLERALQMPQGLLAAGGDLSQERILAAYRRGIFPWYSHEQPILWWSPDPRMVLWPDRFKVSRSLGKSLRRALYATRLDTQFGAVIRACAAPRRGCPETWLNADMISAYEHLHQQGFAHSIEVLRGEELVGGLYGLQLGGVFFGESMFSTARDASKFALERLVRECMAREIHLIDCQVASEHLHSLGGEEVPRARFVEYLDRWARSDPSTWRGMR